MKITIKMDTPSWTENEIQYWFEYLVNDIQEMNMASGDDARITSFVVDGSEYIQGESHE